MKQTFDFWYKRGGFDAKCEIELDNDNATVVMRELDDNPGTSTTNAAEHIATRVFKEFVDQKHLAMNVRWYEFSGGVLSRVTFASYSTRSGYGRASFEFATEVK